jgi:hypothetical protein
LEIYPFKKVEQDVNDKNSGLSLVKKCGNQAGHSQQEILQRNSHGGRRELSKIDWRHSPIPKFRHLRHPYIRHIYRTFTRKQQIKYFMFANCEQSVKMRRRIPKINKRRRNEKLYRKFIKIKKLIPPSKPQPSKQSEIICIDVIKSLLDSVENSATEMVSTTTTTAKATSDSSDADDNVTYHLVDRNLEQEEQLTSTTTSKF